ncbi:MAG: hypothetical protein L3J35_11890 [Bacteroidales bacterium]|nr:hypothetical protein [Bacteroidales bacterium]
MKKKHFIIKTGVLAFVLVAVLSFFSCDENQSKIPTVYVDFYVDLTNPAYNNLINLGGYVYVTGGVNGILIYHSSLDEYQAYERTCPYDPDCGKVYVNELNFNAVDSVCCGSEFSLLLSGTVSQGPSVYPLKMYSCTFDINTNTLHIKN